MSSAFPFLGLWTGFWSLSLGTYFEVLALATITSTLFPWTLNAAVTTSPVSQLFFRKVVPHREARMSLALRANALGSVASFVSVLLSFGILSATDGDIEILTYLLLVLLCPLLVPGLCEGFLWSHWMKRPLMMRAMVAHVTGRCAFVAMILGARWIRERVVGSWIERYRGVAPTLIHGVGFFCLGILILAWLRSPRIINVPDSAVKETVT